ncbi:hypothetical protein RvY_02335 [Ramazzottius varieornatus]|uniref:DH domain-containing protein n=1 Tax=Ramazzottius varieornatus TaxID=947166 RepID=A0A1D1UK54_RAMVA|nr:hypothetical protein RvY_02335 [Ramazzottius varieornatus]
MVDILESFTMAEDIGDFDGAPEPRKSSPASSSEYEVHSVDTNLSADSGLSCTHDLDRHSVWRNSSSSTGSSASGSSTSHRSSLSLAPNDVLSHPSTRRSSLGNTAGSKIHFVMDEIIQTERSYVEDLKQVIQGYLRPMRESPVFTAADVDQVFGNLEQLMAFHEKFYGLLLPPDLSGPVFIARRFVQHATDFDIYAEYCLNFPTSCECLALLTKEQPEWFRDRQTDLGHVLPLGPYLLKPIQRILKYHLLLQKLLDNCDADMPGYASVRQAHEDMKDIAQKINDLQQQRDRTIRLEELQLLLIDKPAHLNLFGLGELSLEDTFRVIGVKGERNLCLFDKGLLIVKKREDRSLLYKNYIAHSNLMLSEVIADNPLQFIVIPFDSPRNQIVIEAKSLDQKRLWTTKLKNLMLKHYPGAKISDHVQQLVMQLGSHTTAQDESVNSSPRRFRPAALFGSPATPHYLHKRRAKSPGPAGNGQIRNAVTRQSRRNTAPQLDCPLELPKNPEELVVDMDEGFQVISRSPSSTMPPKKTSVEKFDHVSTSYIPTMKEDKFKYEEIQVTNSSNPETKQVEPSTVASSQHVHVTHRRREHSAGRFRLVSDDEDSQTDMSQSMTGILRTGLRTVYGKARGILKPTKKSPPSKSEDSVQFKDLSSSSSDTSSNKFGVVEPREFLFDVLDSVNDLALCPVRSVENASTASEQSSLANEDIYEKELQTQLDSLDGVNLDFIDGAESPQPTKLDKLPPIDSGKGTVRRKGAIKKKSVKDPKTKSPSHLIEQRIKSLEKQSVWNNDDMLVPIMTSTNDPNAPPETTAGSSVVIVQLPFDFENLFTQPLTKRLAPPSVHVSVTDSSGNTQTVPITGPLQNLHPRHRRKLKIKKSVIQHLEEIASSDLRVADNEKDIFCIPCDTVLTEFGKVKKSSVKLHLTCKRHIFNVKLEERKANAIPPEIKLDEHTSLYRCILCCKAVSQELHDIKRHCASKRHVRLLEERQEAAANIENKSSVREDGVLPPLRVVDEQQLPAPKISARDYNNEFVYDVLDFVMKTSGQLSALKDMKKLIGRWTTMSLPTIDAIRRNHLPRYLEKNPDIARRLEQASARKVARMRIKLGESTEGLPLGNGIAEPDPELQPEEPEHEPEEIYEEQHTEEEVVQMQRPTSEEQVDVDLEEGVGSTTLTELEQAISAFAQQNQDQMFSVADFGHELAVEEMQVAEQEEQQ